MQAFIKIITFAFVYFGRTKMRKYANVRYQFQLESYWVKFHRKVLVVEGIMGAFER